MMKKNHLMSPRLFALLIPLILLMGCSTPQSEDVFDTILCWLRPSCLPSQPPQVKPTRPKPSSPPPKLEQILKTVPKHSGPQTHVQKSSPNNDPPPCLPSIEAEDSASDSIKRISYKEPTRQADGKTLTDLKKTSIYFQATNDPEERTLMLECAATKHQGGGMIPEGGGTIQVTISEKISPDSKICVSATDTTGNEGESICEPIGK